MIRRYTNVAIAFLAAALTFLVFLTLWMFHLSHYYFWAGSTAPYINPENWAAIATMYWRFGIASLAGSVLLLILLVWLVRHRHQPQFSLRSLLIAVLIASCFGSWIAFAIRDGQIVGQPANATESKPKLGPEAVLEPVGRSPERLSMGDFGRLDLAMTIVGMPFQRWLHPLHHDSGGSLRSTPATHRPQPHIDPSHKLQRCEDAENARFFVISLRLCVSAVKSIRRAPSAKMHQCPTIVRS